MGTRHLIVVTLDGKPKIAQYGQWDGYPSYTGVKVLDFIRKIQNQKHGVAHFIGQVEKCRFMNKKEREKIDNMDPLPAEFTRDTGCKILDFVNESQAESIKLVNGIEFAMDSLFCEWAYVIDLNENTLEVYKGFNKEPLKIGERFYKYNKKIKADSEYYPIKLSRIFMFEKLPSNDEFVRMLDPTEEE